MGDDLEPVARLQCPRCGSRRVGREPVVRSLPLPLYRCLECDAGLGTWATRVACAAVGTVAALMAAVDVWELFAGLAAIFSLPVGLSFLLYPDVFALSKGYQQLAHMFVIPQPLGVVALVSALCVLLGIGTSLGRWGLLVLTLFWMLMTLSSFASVGVSGGTIWFLLFFGLALFGFLRSGGVKRPSRSP